MIINIRGTSGSGKSHLVRAIMKLYAEKYPIHIKKRRQPISYVLHPHGVKWVNSPKIPGKKSIKELRYPPGKRPLSVLGHYETACGGCDTINSYSQLLTLIRNRHKTMDVLYEGLLISGDVKQTMKLFKKFKEEYQIVIITTPLAQCLKNVNKRRKARMGEKFMEVKPINTERKYKCINMSAEKLEEAGIKVTRLGPRNALKYIREELGI